MTPFRLGTKVQFLITSSLALLILVGSGCGGSIVTVGESAPLKLTLPNNLLYPLEGANAPGVQGSAINLEISATGKGSIRLSCAYETVGLDVSDLNHVPTEGALPCSSLKTIAAINNVKVVTSGVFTSTSGTDIASATISWTPTPTQRGTYKFTITGTETSEAGVETTGSESLYVTVMDPYTTANLLTLLDSHFSGLGSAAPLSTVPSRPSLSGTGEPFRNIYGTVSGDLSLFTSIPSVSSFPYSLSFNGSGDKMGLSTILEGRSSFGLQAWVKASAPTSAGAVIAGNGGGSGNGFVLRQSTTPAGRAEFAVGQKYYSYKDLVLSDKPAGYWRLGEAAPTPSPTPTFTPLAADLSAGGVNGTYTILQSGNFTLANVGAQTGDAATS